MKKVEGKKCANFTTVNGSKAFWIWGKSTISDEKTVVKLSSDECLNSNEMVVCTKMLNVNWKKVENVFGIEISAI